MQRYKEVNADIRAPGRLWDQVEDTGLIDLSRHFCDAARCYPVVGGLYAYKDTGHITYTSGTQQYSAQGPALNDNAAQPRPDPSRTI